MKKNLNLSLLSLLFTAFILASCSSSKKHDDTAKNPENIVVSGATGASAPTGSQ